MGPGLSDQARDQEASKSWKDHSKQFMPVAACRMCPCPRRHKTSIESQQVQGTHETQIRSAEMQITLQLHNHVYNWKKKLKLNYSWRLEKTQQRASAEPVSQTSDL
jgi:hypothetical protein